MSFCNRHQIHGIVEQLKYYIVKAMDVSNHYLADATIVLISKKYLPSFCRVSETATWNMNKTREALCETQERRLVERA